MIMSALHFFEGFWTWQTPVSFLAGIGVYHLYCRAAHTGVYDDRENDVREEG